MCCLQELWCCNIRNIWCCNITSYQTLYWTHKKLFWDTLLSFQRWQLIKIGSLCKSTCAIEGAQAFICKCHHHHLSKCSIYFWINLWSGWMGNEIPHSRPVWFPWKMIGSRDIIINNARTLFCRLSPCFLDQLRSDIIDSLNWLIDYSWLYDLKPSLDKIIWKLGDNISLSHFCRLSLSVLDQLFCSYFLSILKIATLT